MSGIGEDGSFIVDHAVASIEGHYPITCRTQSYVSPAMTEHLILLEQGDRQEIEVRSIDEALMLVDQLTRAVEVLRRLQPESSNAA